MTSNTPRTGSKKHQQEIFQVDTICSQPRWGNVFNGYVSGSILEDSMRIALRRQQDEMLNQSYQQFTYCIQ